MNIENMTDEKKSVMLAKLVGWLTVDSGWYKYRTPDGKGTQVNATRGYSETDIFGLCPTLYNPANMALAWRVLNWANQQTKRTSAQKAGGSVEWDEPWGTFIDDWLNPTGYEWFGMEPETAQRELLDKILTLAIEAGMVGETS